jgi:hypothetical protein
MTRAEAMKLTPDQKKERKKLQDRKYYGNNKDKAKEYREANKEKISKRDKEYREANKEKISKRDKEYYGNNKEIISKKDKVYRQTPEGKKKKRIKTWKFNGLQESPENIERIYDLWQTQELCNACDVQLTRNGDNDPAQACMDHDHNTNRFRHIICRACNNNDNWQKHFC